MNKKLLAINVSLALFATGCSLAPDYERPETPVVAEWDAQPTVTAPLNWEEQFTDPDLQKLIKLALENNRDLKYAVQKPPAQTQPLPSRHQHSPVN